MSALRFSFAARRAPLRTIGAVRSFQTSRALAASKESTLNQEGRAEEAEAHKQDQLQKQKEGKGHWKDELASDSESIIKADRNEAGSTSDDIKKLQQETEKLAKDKKI
ncbi:hypothetical protein LTR62_003943 [Meristemomyces frigidus]|uniref:Mitochondrial carrier protein pet8 n=1 Tax=Meristemomyces frigidus TaxID=1508187 RepID=A0AAN7THW1_9PEZI|nr:hypothetical protein LTR62_003943 [Meristemomyces frigidus]